MNKGLNFKEIRWLQRSHSKWWQIWMGIAVTKAYFLQLEKQKNQCDLGTWSLPQNHRYWKSTLKKKVWKKKKHLPYERRKPIECNFWLAIHSNLRSFCFLGCIFLCISRFLKILPLLRLLWFLDCSRLLFRAQSPIAWTQSSEAPAPPHGSICLWACSFVSACLSFLICK